MYNIGLAPEHDPKLVLLEYTSSAFGAIDFADTTTWGVLPAPVNNTVIAFTAFSTEIPHLEQDFSHSMFEEVAIAASGLLLYTTVSRPSDTHTDKAIPNESLPLIPAAYGLYACADLKLATESLVSDQKIPNSVRLQLGITTVHGEPKAHLSIVKLHPLIAINALLHLGCV